jgi:hypothetical protein
MGTSEVFFSFVSFIDWITAFGEKCRPAWAIARVAPRRLGRGFANRRSVFSHVT